MSKGFRGTELHNCNELKNFLGKDRNSFFTIKREEDCWTLTIVRCASEPEVKMGEAKYIGEEKLNYMFQIRFCPFCGKKFAEESSVEPTS